MAVPEAGLAGSKPEDRAKPVAVALDIILSSQGWGGMRAWPGSDGAYSLVRQRQPLWPLPETKWKGRALQRSRELGPGPFNEITAATKPEGSVHMVSPHPSSGQTRAQALGMEG